MKVTVNDDCIGCGLCESICPLVFQMQGDRSCVVGDAANCLDETMEAASSCPVDAIQVE